MSSLLRHSLSTAAVGLAGLLSGCEQATPRTEERAPRVEQVPTPPRPTPDTITLYHIPTAHEDSAIVTQTAALVDSLAPYAPVVYEDNAPENVTTVTTELRTMYQRTTPADRAAHLYSLLAETRMPSLPALARGTVTWQYGNDAALQQNWQAILLMNDEIASMEFSELAREYPTLYQQFRHNLHEAREDSLLATAARNADPAIMSTFGCFHDLKDNVAKWNSTHAKPQYKLTEVWAPAWGTQRCDEARATLQRLDSVAAQALKRETNR